MFDETRLRLEVIVDRGDDVIAGTIRSSTGSGVDFTGWLEFMSAVDTLSARESGKSTDRLSTDDEKSAYPAATLPLSRPGSP